MSSAGDHVPWQMPATLGDAKQGQMPFIGKAPEQVQSAPCQQSSGDCRCSLRPSLGELLQLLVCFVPGESDRYALSNGPARTAFNHES